MLQLPYFSSTIKPYTPMATLLAFAGSNSSTSINYQLVQYTVTLVRHHTIQLLNMVQYPFPLYSEDDEKHKGFPHALVALKNEIQQAGGLILSVNEHNGNPSAYFKNVVDWLSRLERKFLEGKKVLLMATSGGARGASGSLEVVQNLLPRFGAEIAATFSLPQFYDHFKDHKIADEKLKTEHQIALDTFLATLS